MPKSKHRRGGKNRPREFQTHAPEKKAASSAPWVPVVGTALLVLGVLVILVGYLPPVQEVTSGWPLLRNNWGLVGGFILMIGGFGVLTRWR